MFRNKEVIVVLEPAEINPIDKATKLPVGKLFVDQTPAQDFNIDVHNNIMNDVTAYFAATDEMQRSMLARKLEMVLPDTDANKGKSIRQILDETPSSRAQHFTELFEQSLYFSEISKKYNEKVAQPVTKVADVVDNAPQGKTDAEILNEV